MSFGEKYQLITIDIINIQMFSQDLPVYVIVYVCDFMPSAFRSISNTGLKKLPVFSRINSVVLEFLLYVDPPRNTSTPLHLRFRVKLKTLDHPTQNTQIS